MPPPSARTWSHNLQGTTFVALDLPFLSTDSGSLKNAQTGLFLFSLPFSHYHMEVTINNS